MKKLNNIFLGKKILVYGLGKSGISTYKFLKKSSDVYLFDDNHRINLKFNRKIISSKQIEKINFDRIIISPGIDISNCKLSKFLNNNLLKIHTDLDVLFSFYDNKSTTSFPENCPAGSQSIEVLYIGTIVLFSIC